MNYQTILVEQENGICTITINRPDKLNALNKDVFDELDQAIAAAISDAAVRSVIITGAGEKAFVAGADISEFNSLDEGGAKALASRGQAVFARIEHAPKPVVAAVNGFALGGGCELAMACHFRLASNKAKFGQPEVNLGLIPGYGGTQRLTKLIGKGKSMELQMTGAMITADEALTLGLVNYVTTPEELIPKTKDILSVIATKAPLAVAGVIECINRAVDNEGLDQEGKNGFAKEVDVFGKCFTTADRIEGTTAFLEKRKANFTGK